MSEGLGLIFLALGTGLTLTAAFASLSVLFPRVIEATRLAAEEVPGRCFLVGLVNFLFLSLLSLGLVGLSQALDVQIFLLPAFGLAAAVIVALLFGLTGAVQLIGGRLLPEFNLRAQTLWGGVILILAVLTPVVGWFALFPYVGLLGLGAFILSRFRRALKDEPATGTVPGASKRDGPA